MMRTKIAWSRQEAVVLLDGYIEVLQGEHPRLYIVKRVSADLRKMAINNGMEIDDVYRNENGISFQMQRMESAYCGKTVKIKATLLFNEIVNLYNTNRISYENLLQEARVMIDSKFNYKESFSLWLAETMPSIPIITVLASCDKIEEFCLKLRILRASLFEITDLNMLKTIQKTVSQNKIFRYINKKQLKHIDAAMYYLLKYIREGNLEKRDITTVPAQDLSTPKQHETQIITMKSQNEARNISDFYVRTDLDRRLIAKYPLVYKRIFYVLRDIFNHEQAGITIADLYDRINHIARCADIEDILDNVSWSAYENKQYVFSQEIVQHIENTKPQAHTVISDPASSEQECHLTDFGASDDLVFTNTSPNIEAITHDELQLTLDEKYRGVLIRNFRKGFRLGSPIELRKFKRCYEQVNEKALDDDDATIARKIIICGIQFEDKIFIPQTMLGKETRERLFTYIRKSFDEGKTALYYQALFNEFSEDFLDYYIYNADMLKAYLSFMLSGKYYFGKNYLAIDANIETDLIDEIRTCLQDYAVPMTYDVMFEYLPHIPQQKIKQVLATNGEFVSNGRGEYFHVSSVNITNEEWDDISSIIATAIGENEYLSGNELIDAIRSRYPYIYEKNSYFSVVGLRDAIKYHLCNKFSFSGNIISKLGSNLTMSDVFADYCRTHDSFTLDELNILASELGSIIYFDTVYENSLRISHQRFIAKKHAHFLVLETDAILDRFCTGCYISIDKISEYSLFPNAGFPWNKYLLEHYTAAYSDNYTLLHTGFNANKCVGAIVKRSAGFESFNDCIVTVLADSRITLKKQHALQYLCDEGYIARRNLSNIEELLIKATAKRNRKEAN